MEKNINNMKQSEQQISQKRQDIKYDTRDYVVGYLVQMFEEENIYIPLEYQRNFIWQDKDKCYFIESLLMGLPIPFMFFADTDDGRIEIVDGAQRIQTLVSFIEDEFKLTNLRILTKSNGLLYSQLSQSVQRRLRNTSLRVVFLEEGTTEKVRQEIFHRINQSGIRLKASENRRGSLEGPFKDFLEQCAQDKRFCEMAPRTAYTEKRYEGFELVSRFFAYTDSYSNDFSNYDGRVAQYIDEYVNKMNEMCNNDEKIIAKYQQRFNKMLDYAEKALGKRGFRKSETSKSTPRARFEALSIGIAIALKENPNLPIRNISAWIDSEEFLNCVKSDAANNKSKLKYRIDFVKNQLLEKD